MTISASTWETTSQWTRRQWPDSIRQQLYDFPTGGTCALGQNSVYGSEDRAAIGDAEGKNAAAALVIIGKAAQKREDRNLVVRTHGASADMGAAPDGGVQSFGAVDVCGDRPSAGEHW